MSIFGKTTHIVVKDGKRHMRGETGVYHLPMQAVVTAVIAPTGEIFLQQDPPVIRSHQFSDQEKLIQYDSFLGIGASIDHNKVTPPELPQLLQYVLATWHWEIHPDIRRRLCLADPQIKK